MTCPSEKMVNKKEYIIQELYNILEKLRYPEVAQTRFEEFESTILVGSKRIDLLHWLLQESPGFNSLSLNTLKDNTLNDKLSKCYSEIGLCQDDNILLNINGVIVKYKVLILNNGYMKTLLGKCVIDKQLQFLSLLTLFIKNVHLADTESLKTDKQAANNILKADTENTNVDSNKSIKNITNVKSEANFNTKTESLEFPKHLIDEQFTEKYTLDEMCLNVKKNIEEIKQPNSDNYEPVLQKFNTSFKTVTSLPSQEIHSDIFSEFYSDLSTDIQNIHSAFSIINKTIINETKIKNQSIPENLIKAIKPLTQAIQDNLVLIEQACNTFNQS